jgi:hypothetical protein
VKILRYSCCLLAMFLLGCASSARTRQLLVTPYTPKNVYTAAPTLPAFWAKVAVLPLASNPAESLSTEAIEVLQPIWLAELRRQARFDVVPVTPGDLQVWTGQSSWRAQEVLPPKFLDMIREKTGCQAILFAEITAYRPYPPLRVGWAARLVDAADARSAWGIDEVFDAGDPAVMAAAEAYARQSIQPSLNSGEDPSLLRSPRRFGQYVLNAVTATLPARHKNH